ncbi:hypothetical protein [Streptomyces sp. NPDC006510]|uniref:hypothetical protein n=1 Tax=Streptomyces sp. NPDC006510 TaxID=3155600 RepID=UPI0033B851B6
MYVVAFTAVLLLFVAIVFAGQSLENQWFTPLIALAPTAPEVWTVFFVFIGSATMVRTVFGTSEVHSALPALLTGVLVWEPAAINLVMDAAGPAGHPDLRPDRRPRLGLGRGVG